MSRSALFFLLLVAAMAIARSVELRIARRNAAAMLGRGGIEVGRGHYPWMVALHTAFLLACPIEALVLGRPFLPWLGWPMLGLLAGAMALRYWAIQSLGSRWTTRIVLVPDEPVIRRGPYRFIRHPNYLAVIAELAALPLIHGAWLTALVTSALNAWLLAVRIRTEEAALERRADYRAAFGRVPRFAGTVRRGS